MMLFEKMNAAMRHSAEEGKKRRELDAQKNGGMRAELERGDVCAMLISAFLGYEKTMHAYEIAVQEKYRFFSFGDAMCILPETN